MKKPLREYNLSSTTYCFVVSTISESTISKRRRPILGHKKYLKQLQFQRTFLATENPLRQYQLSSKTCCFCRSIPLSYIGPTFVGLSPCHILFPPPTVYPLVRYWSHLRPSIPLSYICTVFVGLFPCHIFVPPSSFYPLVLSLILFCC